jgi:hypothetical protein
MRLPHRLRNLPRHLWSMHRLLWLMRLPHRLRNLPRHLWSTHRLL